MKKLILSVTTIAGLSMVGYAQTGDFLYTGSETTITLQPGLYDITAYGARGGNCNGYLGGGGAEMEAQFNFATTVSLTLLVGGAGANGRYPGSGGGGGGGGTGGGYSSGGGGGYSGTGTGGSYYFDGGGGSSFLSGGGGGGGGSGGSAGGGGGFGGGGGGGTASGGGGGGYSGGGGGLAGGGAGGGSIIDSSAISDLAEVSGIASPDGSPNGEIIITAIPEPSTLAMATVGIGSVLGFGCRRFKP
jgi:hypothetical protein